MTTIFDYKENAPKVFISYSYDSEEHKKWVTDLTNTLRQKAGINATIDVFALNKTTDLDEIMTSGYKDSDKVVIILTKKYAEKVDDSDTGVGFENKLSTIIAKDKKTNNKLIFIKRDSSFNFKEVFPFIFRDHYAIEMSNDSEFQTKFEELYHRIWNKPFNEPAPIGDSPFNIKEQSTPQSVLEINGVNIYNVIEQSGFEPYNVHPNDLGQNSIVIWPVVPRQHITLIHYAQIEVIRLLSLLGWQTKVIVANCGNGGIAPSKLDIDFKDKLENYFKKKDINNVSFDYLNRYFSPTFTDGSLILNNFVKISGGLKITKLDRFNTKEDSYDQKAKSDISERSTLKYISPLFTWSASIYEAKTFHNINNNTKAIIIAGRDEESQWSHVISEIDANIGAIFIPILKQDDKNTVFQEKNLTFLSKTQIERELGKGNTDKWLFQAFICLAAFPQLLSNLSFCKNKETQCQVNKSICIECLFPNDNEKFNGNVDKKKFTEEIYSKINL